ncbi:MAG TPA: hypothetical protein PLC99_22340 [Verrucomicrobiota bacterium]|nr:hypothetical protein [Verrucomicrobiota bacterium]
MSKPRKHPVAEAHKKRRARFLYAPAPKEVRLLWKQKILRNITDVHAI